MKVRFKTKEQLLKEGWFERNDYLYHNNQYSNTIAPEMFKWFGKTIEVEPYPHPVPSSRYVKDDWNISDMMVEAKEERFKELIALWEKKSNGV